MFDCAIVEPPKPRLRTGKGAMSCFRLLHSRIEELPTNSTGHGGGGLSRSNWAKRRISSRKGASAGSSSVVAEGTLWTSLTVPALAQAAKEIAANRTMRFILVDTSAHPFSIETGYGVQKVPTALRLPGFSL
jgi:hypothetical protein